jgi:hypothetical protein
MKPNIPSSSSVYASYSICFRALNPGLIFQSRVYNQLVVFGFARHSAKAPAELGSSPIRIGDVLSGINDISFLDGEGMKVEDQLAILAAAEAFSTRDTCLHFLRPLPSSSLVLHKPLMISSAMLTTSSESLQSSSKSTTEPSEIIAIREHKNNRESGPIMVDDVVEIQDIVQCTTLDAIDDTQENIVCNHGGASVVDRYEGELVAPINVDESTSSLSMGTLASRLRWANAIDQNKLRALVRKGIDESQIKKGFLATTILNSHTSNLGNWLQGKVSLQPNSTMISLLFRWLARGCPTTNEGFSSSTSILPDRTPLIGEQDQQVVGAGLPAVAWSWVSGGRPALEAAWLRDELKMEREKTVDQTPTSLDTKLEPITNILYKVPRRPDTISICCWLGLWEASRVHPDRGDGKRDGPICVRRVLGPRGDIRALEHFLTGTLTDDMSVAEIIANRPRIRLLPTLKRPPPLGGIQVTSFRAEQSDSHVLGHHKADGTMRIGQRYQAELPSLCQTYAAELKDKLLWSAAAFRQKTADTSSDYSKSETSKKDALMLGEMESSLSSKPGEASIDIVGPDAIGTDGGAARSRGRANRRSAGPPSATQDQESGLVSSSSLIAAASTPLPGATRFLTFFSLGRLPVPTIEYGDDVFSLTLLQVCGFSFPRATDLLNTILNTLSAEASRLNDIDTNICKRKPTNSRSQIVTESVISRVIHQKKRGRGADVVSAPPIITFPEIHPPHPLLAEYATPVTATLGGLQKSFLFTPGLRCYSKSELTKMQADLISHFDVSNSSTPFDESVVENRLQYSMLPDSAKPCPKNPMSALAWASCVCMLDFKLTPIQVAQKSQFIKTQVLKKFLGGTSNLGPASLAQLLNWMKVNLHPTVREELVSSLKSFSVADLEADCNLTKTFATAIEASTVFFPTEEVEPEIEEISQVTSTTHTTSPVVPPLLVDALREAFVGACGRFSWNILDRCLFEINAELHGKRLGKLSQGIAFMKQFIFEIPGKVSSTTDVPVPASSHDVALNVLGACQTAMAAVTSPSVSDCVSYFYKPWPGQGNIVSLEFQHWRKRLNYNPLSKTSSAKFLQPSEVSLPELLDRASKGDTMYFSYTSQQAQAQGASSKRKAVNNDDSSESEGANSGSGSNPSLQKLAARINAEYTPLIIRLEEMIQRGNSEAGDDSDDEDDEMYKSMISTTEPDVDAAEEPTLPADNTTAQLSGEMKPIGHDIEINVEERFFGVHTEECAVCEYGGNIVSCASCERQYHFPCIGRTSSLTLPPDGLGLWTCPVCDQRYASDSVGLHAARSRIQLELEVDLARKRFAYGRRRVSRADNARRVIDKIILRYPYFPAPAVKKLVYDWACFKDPEEMSLNTRVGCPLLFSSSMGINLHGK